MKKLFIILLLSILFIPNVNADENVTTFTVDKDTFNTNYETYNRYKSIIGETLINYADSDDYYVITIYEVGALNDINLIIWDENSFIDYEADQLGIQFGVRNYKYFIQFYDDEISNLVDNSNHENTSFRNLSSLFPNNLVDTNYNFYQKFYSTLEINGIFNDNIILENGTLFPTLKQLYNFNSWQDYLGSQLIEVNLDNYEYVILTLKDYFQKETFTSNLQIKGMIGITPVYEFGTVEKTEITDRCNISYSDFTDYRLYILKSDLQNNSVYYVKACEVGSSFKFDNTVFDITYISLDDADNPTITYNGITYDAISFDKLSSTANKNEEENFVPGESKNSLSSIIDNIDDTLSGVWSAFTNFMGFVTKVFNTLPIEFRSITITIFTVSLVLGLIKIFKS